MRGDDLIRPFQVEGAGVRGRLVRLGPTVDEIVRRHDYPPPIARLLSEGIALAAILAGALKYEGVFSLQAKGDGITRMLVVDCTSEGKIRGYAQFDAEELARLTAETAGQTLTVPRLMGGGYLAFTVDQGDDTERYQGIVPLEGATLAECAHKYFRDSEQVQTAIRIATGLMANGNGEVAWRAGAIMVQRLPEGDPAMMARGAEPDRSVTDEDWRRAVTLMATVADGELTDPGLAADDLLYWLYHEDGVRVFEPHGLAFGCRCSRPRAERVLEALSAEAIEDLTVDGKLDVTCEFCNSKYDFDAAAFGHG